jgi:hypothetical protein
MNPFIALGVAVGAYALTKSDGGSVPPTAQPTLPAGQKPQTRQQRIAGIKAAANPGGHYDGTKSPIVAPVSVFPNGTETEYSQEVINAAKAEMEKQWESLSATAKREACNRIKAEFPDDPSIQSLDCGSNTFQQILTVTAAAIGTYYGGPVGGALAVASVQLFGKPLENFCADAWEGIKSAFGGGDGLDQIGFCRAASENAYYGLTPPKIVRAVVAASPELQKVCIANHYEWY